MLNTMSIPKVSSGCLVNHGEPRVTIHMIYIIRAKTMTQQIPKNGLNIASILNHRVQPWPKIDSIYHTWLVFCVIQLF